MKIRVVAKDGSVITLDLTGPWMARERAGERSRSNVRHYEPRYRFEVRPNIMSLWLFAHVFDDDGFYLEAVDHRSEMPPPPKEWRESLEEWSWDRNRPIIWEEEKWYGVEKLFGNVIPLSRKRKSR